MQAGGCLRRARRPPLLPIARAIASAETSKGVSRRGHARAGRLILILILNNTSFPKMDRRASVTAISKLPPSQIFHPRGTSTQVAQKNLWNFQKRLEVPNAFGSSTQVAHKLHIQQRPTISHACPCHCPFRGARARAIPRHRSVKHRNTQDKVRRMARKAARVPMANAP